MGSNGLAQFVGHLSFGTRRVSVASPVRTWWTLRTDICEILNRREVFKLAIAGSCTALSEAILPAPEGVRLQSRRFEAQALRQFAETTHPRGIEAAASKVWHAALRPLDHADTMSDGAYVVALRTALAWFEDGHTTVLPFEYTGGVPDAMKSGPFGNSLPIRVRVFDDGVWITLAGGEAISLLGYRILSVAGIPIEEVVAKAVSTWPGENPAWGYNWSWLLFTSTGLLRGLGVLSGPADAPVPIVA